MANIEIITMLAELAELESLIEEAKAEAESIKDTIKSEMTAREVDELEAGEHIIRWTPVTTNRFDSAKFKKALPEVYKAYLKQTTSKRFTVSKL